MSNNILPETKLITGKYAGHTYQYVIEHDINYCKFLKSLPNVREPFQEFLLFLNDNLDKQLKLNDEKRIKKILDRIQQNN